jgi:hypothetical protein
MPLAAQESSGALIKDFAAGAAREARETGKAALRSKTGQRMAAGAALGAVAAAAVPFIGWATGAVLGAGIVAYRRLLK